MFGFLSVFKYNKKENYEAVLAELDEKIKAAELNLADIKLQRGYYSGTTFIYIAILYIFYVPFYFFFLRSPYLDDWYNAGIKGAPVIVVPIFLYFIRSLLDYFFAKRISSKEELLKALRTKQKIKVEELKKNSSYYQTKSLIDRYSERPNMELKALPATQNGKRLMPAPSGSKQAPNSHPGPVRGHNKNSQTSNGISRGSTSNGQANGERYWYDKLVDAIVGEENPTVPQFALICQHCFSHNGLVSPIEYETIQYKCPSCQKFNPSKRSLRRKSIDIQDIPKEQKALAQNPMARSASHLPRLRQQATPNLKPRSLRTQSPIPEHSPKGLDQPLVSDNDESAQSMISKPELSQGNESAAGNFEESTAE